MAKEIKSVAKAAAPTTVVADDSAPAAMVRALSENRLKLVLSSAADLGNLFAATTPIGTAFEDVLNPEFWAHTAYKLRPADEIIVHTDDMSYRGHLYVRHVHAPGAQRLNNRAVVAKLSFQEFGAIDKDLRNTTHEVKFMGPHQKWCVVSLSDQRVVKEGCGTSDEAAQWMRNRAA